MAITTVIIPCGPRHVHLLPRAIYSAHAQTLPVEVMYLIDTEGKGPAWARNQMAEKVTTPFITMLDADDVLQPNFVEECLKAWKPTLYVTSDWFQGSRHVKAVSCYGLRQQVDESSFHLPPSLFPTAYWHALEGQDETLFGAEDTDFFLKANVKRIGHVIVRKPLFHYTPDGYRSNEARQDSRWQSLIVGLFKKYRGDMSMGCCGDINPPTHLPVGTRLEGDILARPKWNALQKTHGTVSGRKYGVISKHKTVWIDPRDLTSKWEQVTDWEGLAPTPDEINEALKIDTSDPVAVLEHEIKRAGIRTSWEPVVTSGYDIQQTPAEIAEFILFVEGEMAKGLPKSDQAQKVPWPTMLEIGTGSSGGLARFLTHRGWKVTSIDLNVPEPAPEWEFIQGDSKTIDIGERTFDVVFIDGDHSLEGVMSDHERFKDMGMIVAFHDIAETGWWPETAAYWKNLAYTEKGNRRKGFYEALVPESAQGLGWYVSK